MTRGTALLVHLSSTLVAGTGLVYAWMLYLVEPVESEFGLALVNHPWQPEVQALHVLVAPLLVFALGYLWPVHVLARLRSGNPAGRRTGVALGLVLVPMITSAYLLQVSVDEAWREAWTWLHVGSSVLWCLLYLAHLWTKRRAASAPFEWDPDLARMS